MAHIITNEKYVASIRCQIVSLIKSMLSGEVCFLEGSRQLSSLQREAAVDDGDPDFLVFVAIASETDSLPIGAARTHWSAEALARHQPELEAATKWAREIGIEACHSILRKFNA